MSAVWFLLTLLPILGGAERFNCKGRILGAYYADSKSGCKAFHVCVRVAGGGVRDFRFFCPPGTLFHQEAQTCTDWGDDDPLACPADIYDGQFELYRIGSGYDTRKLSSSGNREDEAEFGLQRAETGDRRLSQNNAVPNSPSSDLRAAHSSDFFTGQRDRGRDDSVQAPVAPPAPPAPRANPDSPPQQRQSFRRPSTQRTIPTTQFTTPSPTTPPQPSKPSYETSKRKLLSKRPIYASTAPPTTYPPDTPPQQTYSEPVQNFNRRPSKNRQVSLNVPSQYKQFKDEYVEVSRVTPKQNRFYPSYVPSTSTFPTSTNAPRYEKKDSLIELYNYEAQSTPGLSQQNDNRPFKVKNSFSVSEVPQDTQRGKNYNFNNVRDNPTTTDYSVTTRITPSTTPAYKNFNSVSYEPEKNNFVSYSKQNYFNTPTANVPTTTIYTTSRSEPPLNLNTVAYNTNNAFQTPSNNYGDNDEDDGQYHPPHGEDDGQYRPELYYSELLSGAHSLNIAASGNRLPEERKQHAKTKPPQKPAQTAAPRPFRPAPTPTLPPTTRAPEPSTTYVQQSQRTFDYYQTYTTTSRPVDYLGLGQNVPSITELPPRAETTVAPREPETRPTRPPSRAPVQVTSPPAPAHRPSTRAPHVAHPPQKKEDNSYDYAYYDSDPGFSEYDHIEEFGKTKTRS